jgi:hypothetical protein
MTKNLSLLDKPYLSYNINTDSFTFLPNEALFARFKHDELLDISVAVYYLFDISLKDFDISLSDKEKIISLAEQIAINSCYYYRMKNGSELTKMYIDLLNLFKKQNPELIKVIDSSEVNFDLTWTINMIGGKYAQGDKAASIRAWDNMFSKKIIITKRETTNTICHAYIVHLLFQRFMLHIWLKPKFSIGFHKKLSAPKGQFLWIKKY